MPESQKPEDSKQDADKKGDAKKEKKDASDSSLASKHECENDKQYRKEMREMLKMADQIRRFEINLLWKRSLFFGTVLAAILTAIGTLYDKDYKTTVMSDCACCPCACAIRLWDFTDFLTLGLWCIGFVVALCWTLANRGSKYWQEVWEKKSNCFAKRAGHKDFFFHKPVADYIKKGRFWGPWKYSVSRLMIAVSDGTVVVWFFMSGAWGVQRFGCPMCAGHLLGTMATMLLTLVGAYVVLILINARMGEEDKNCCKTDSDKSCEPKSCGGESR